MCSSSKLAGAGSHPPPLLSHHPLSGVHRGMLLLPGLAVKSAHLCLSSGLCCNIVSPSSYLVLCGFCRLHTITTIHWIGNDTVRLLSAYTSLTRPQNTDNGSSQTLTLAWGCHQQFLGRVRECLSPPPSNKHHHQMHLPQPAPFPSALPSSPGRWAQSGRYSLECSWGCSRFLSN